MKTICVFLLMFVALAFASALPANNEDTSVDFIENNPPVAMGGEELETDESRWGYGGWGRRHGGWGGGYGGWGRGYGGGWGHGGWGRGYGHGGWGHGWGYGR